MRFTGVDVERWALRALVVVCVALGACLLAWAAVVR